MRRPGGSPPATKRLDAYPTTSEPEPEPAPEPPILTTPLTKRLKIQPIHQARRGNGRWDLGRGRSRAVTSASSASRSKRSLRSKACCSASGSVST
jgi:hypothetical protein